MDDLLQQPLWRLAEALARGETSAEALTEGYLARIDALDAQGPTLRALISVNPQARREARRLDEEARAGRRRGVLHGLPLLIKDNIEARGMPTTAGSLALAHSRPERDAAVTERLRRAGALILGKTNLSEWANFRSTRSSSGWSSVGGQTKNPYALNRNPCGSSSGSGVAVAAALAAAAIGTETDGSITCPASLCGVVGLKPTVGLVSRRHVVPIAASQDTAGPMTRSVRDAALLTSVIAGPDLSDPITADAKPPTYTPLEPSAFDVGAEFADASALAGARLGVVRSLFGKHPGADAVAEAALTRLSAAGAVILDDVPLSVSDELTEAEYEVLLYEFHVGLERYLASLREVPGADPKAPSTLAELIRFNETHAETVMPYFGQEHFLAALAKGPASSEARRAAYRAARATCLRLSRTEGIDRALEGLELDALVAPSATPAWVTDLINGDHYAGSAATLPAVAGYPHLSVPAGMVHGLPVGLSFFAGAFQEATLLRLGHAFEALRGPLPPPEFRPEAP